MKAGPLRDTPYEEVPKEKLLKAARRYSGDPDFSRFAKSYALLIELQEEEIPEPCLPLVPVNSAKAAHKFEGGWLKRMIGAWLRRLWSWSKYGKLLLLCLCLALIFRPSFARVVSKLIVTTFRVTLRRILSFCISVLEGMLDELIYQVDHLIRESLPPGMSVPEAAAASYQWLSHLASSSFGAAVALLVQYRRAQLG